GDVAALVRPRLRRPHHVAHHDLVAGVLRPGGDRGHRDGNHERQCESHGQLPFCLSPETIRAAPASFPFRISLMSATVSCSSAILVLKFSTRLCCAGSFVGCERTAARLSLIAWSITARFFCRVAAVPGSSAPLSVL